MRKRMFLRCLLLASALVSGALAAVPAGADPGVDEFRAGVFSDQTPPVAGASASTTVQRPEVGADESSAFVVEVSRPSDNGLNRVRVGWAVDPSAYPDAPDVPHLLVEHWFHGGLNTGGFVSKPGAPYHPGMVLTVDQVNPKSFGIVHRNDGWMVEYAGKVLGNFPDSLWDNTFTSATAVGYYGEAAADTPPPCAGMGNTAFGHDPGAALVSDLKVLVVNGKKIRTQPPQTLNPVVDSTTLYDVGGIDPAASSFRYGGPSIC